jgi:hypothetical protein
MAGAEDPAIFLCKNLLKCINKYMATFNSQVLSAFGLTPLNLSYSLSGGDDTVELRSVGTVDDKAVVGIAFNALTTTPVGTFSTLSAFNGTTVRVDRGYNGSEMALVLADGSTSLFTVVTGLSGTTKQTLTTASFDSSWPEIVKLVQLGYR